MSTYQELTKMSTLKKHLDLKYWIAFNNIVKITPKRFKKILNYFPNLEVAWNASTKELEYCGLESKIASHIKEEVKKLNPNQLLEEVEKKDIGVITIKDDNYPTILSEISDPPSVLYYKGDVDIKNKYLLAIVGSRKISEYGKQVTQQLTNDLIKNGITTVSGLALGVDSVVAKTSVNLGQKTIAVLGCGIDTIYPSSNRNLAEDIIKNNGLIISEFCLGTRPEPYNFPQRNRIISGLSLGTLVTEAKEKSGALITAFFALEQNREIFAVPGNINQENSQGTNKLIKLGAVPTTEAEDILKVLNLEDLKMIKENTIKIENENEKTILKNLNKQPTHVDKLVQLCRLDICEINSCLSIMEVKGLVKDLGNQKYIKLI